MIQHEWGLSEWKSREVSEGWGGCGGGGGGGSPGSWWQIESGFGMLEKLH